MPKVSEEHLQVRRQQILSAAFSCFARKGFHKATVHDICDEAGLSPGAVYRYFGGKEEIIEAMVERNAAQNARFAEEVRAGEDTFRMLERLADFHLGRLADSEGVAVEVELWAEATHNPRIRELLRDDFDAHRRLLEGIVRRAQERGEINGRLDPEAVARVMISFFEGLLIQKELDQDDVDVRRYVDVVTAMVGGSFRRGEASEGDK